MEWISSLDPDPWLVEAEYYSNAIDAKQLQKITVLAFLAYLARI